MKLKLSILMLILGFTVLGVVVFSTPACAGYKECEVPESTSTPVPTTEPTGEPTSSPDCALVEVTENGSFCVTPSPEPTEGPKSTPAEKVCTGERMVLHEGLCVSAEPDKTPFKFEGEDEVHGVQK